MKKISIVLAMVFILSSLFCFAGCNFGFDDEKGDNAMRIDIMCYYEVEYNKSNGTYTPAEDGKTPFLGAQLYDAATGEGGFTVEYDNGEKVTVYTVLDQLAKARGAKIKYATGKSLDSITIDGSMYKPGSSVNTERKGTDDDGEDIYYVDMIKWEWKINGEIVENIKDVVIKEGDNIELTLVYDNFTEGENFVYVEDYEIPEEEEEITE